MPITIFCCKSDLVDDKEILESSDEAGFKLAMKHNCLWYHLSSLSCENIYEPMETVITTALSRRIGEITMNNEVLKKRSEIFVAPGERKFLWNLFAPLRCEFCYSGIEYNNPFFRCFAGECKDLRESYCLRCVKEYDDFDHIHPMYEEMLVRTGSKAVRGETTRETLRLACEKFKTRPMFGWSCRNQRQIYHGDEAYVFTHSNQCQWITFGEFAKRAGFVGKGIKRHFKTKDFIGVTGRNRVEWYLADFGLIFESIRSIPIHTSYDAVSIAHLIHNADLQAVFCEKQQLDTYLTLVAEYVEENDHLSLKMLISMDDVAEEEKAKLLAEYKLENKILLFTINEIEALGRAIDNESQPQGSEIIEEQREEGIGPKDIFIIEYTSGSTGKPKGVVTTDENFNAGIKANRSYMDVAIYPSYEPLAHSSHGNDLSHVANGGAVYLYSDAMGDQFFADM